MYLLAPFLVSPLGCALLWSLPAGLVPGRRMLQAPAATELPRTYLDTSLPGVCLEITPGAGKVVDYSLLFRAGPSQDYSWGEGVSGGHRGGVLLQPHLGSSEHN